MMTESTIVLYMKQMKNKQRKEIDETNEMKDNLQRYYCLLKLHGQENKVNSEYLSEHLNKLHVAIKIQRN